MKKSIILLSILSASCAHLQDERDRLPTNYLTSFQNTQAQMRPPTPFLTNDDPLDYSTSFEKLEEIFGNQDFIGIFQNKTSEQISAHNKLILALLKADRETDGQKAGYLNQTEVKRIIDAVRYSKNEQKKRHYDPSGKEGYCYARAILGHVNAINSDVDPSSVKKIWVVGNVIDYPFHVATMVKSEQGWLIIDSAWFPGGGTVEEWIALFKAKNQNNKENMIFIAAGDRFAQNSPMKYSAVDFFNTNAHDYKIENDFYRGYFRDFFEEIENNPPGAFPKRALKASPDRFLIQIEILNLMKEAYPYAFNDSEWVQLFFWADKKLKYLLNTQIERSPKIEDAIIHLSSLGKKLYQDVGFYESSLLDIEAKKIASAFKNPAKLTLLDITKFSDDAVAPHLKLILAQRENQNLVLEVTKYYLEGNRIQKDHPHFREIMTAILSDGKTKTATEKIALEKLAGISDTWAIDLLKLHVRVGDGTTSLIAKAMLKALPADCHDLIRDFIN